MECFEKMKIFPSFKITGKLPRLGRVITGSRHIIHDHLSNEFFDDVITELVEKFSDLVCKVCKQNHSKISSLIDCLQYHKNETVNYFLVHNFVRVGY